MSQETPAEQPGSSSSGEAARYQTDPLPETFTGLIRQAVADGIAEVKTVGYPAHKERGYIHGFERCLNLGSLEQFQAELENLEKQVRSVTSLVRKEEGYKVEDIRELQCFRSSVEHIYKLLCAAWHINKLPGYKNLPAPFARSILQYGRIVGVKHAPNIE